MATEVTTPERARWLRLGTRLAAITIAYNLIEGVVSMAFGACDASLALFGFGIDSFIEVASAVLVLWRLRAEFGGAAVIDARERRAGIAVSVLLVMLGLGTIAGSAWQLVHHEHPSTTVPGLAIALISLSIMVWLWRSKLAVAAALDSRTLRQDAACSLGCVQLSVTLLVGSLLYIIAPALWWADSVAAILIAVLIAREGWQGLVAIHRGEAGGCGCGHACSPGEQAAGETSP